jgi:hypothetical protein
LQARQRVKGAAARARSNRSTTSRSCRRPHGGGVRQVAPLEEPAVARQEDPPFGQRQRDEPLVHGVPLPERVEAEEAEPARQLAEMDVEDEAKIAERPRTKADEGRHVQGLEDRIDPDAVAVREAVIEADRPAVDEDQLDLGVRHAASLDLILDRRRVDEAPDDLPLPLSGRQEVVQLGIEAKGGAAHLRSARTQGS